MSVADELNSYYQSYVQYAQAAGLPTMSKDAYEQGYTGRHWVDQGGSLFSPRGHYEYNFDTGYKGVLGEIYQNIKNQYLDWEARYKNASGGYEYETALPTFTGKESDITTAVQALSGLKKKTINTETSKTTTTPTYSYSPEDDTLYQQVKGEMENISKAGLPEFEAPDATLAQQYVTDWQTKLTELNQPTSDYYLAKLNKQVNDAYMFSNPYAVGSGNQIQATQSATNDYLMNIVAQQNAQALALGESQYTQDYNTAWNQYQSDIGQYNLANQKLLDLSNLVQNANKITSDQQRQDYWSNMQRNWTIADIANAQAYQTAQDQKQFEYAQAIAQNYKTPEQPWYQQVISPILTSAGYAFGGPVGGAIGSGVAGLFGTGSGQTHPYSYMGYGMSNYGNSYGYQQPNFSGYNPQYNYGLPQYGLGYPRQ